MLASSLHHQEQKTVKISCVIDTLYGLMWYRLLVGHRPLNTEFAEMLVEQIIVGIEK